MGAVDDVGPARGGPIPVFGEVVNLLWQAGQFVEARQVENAWNQVGLERPISLLCSYDAQSSVTEQDIDFACHQHAQVTRDLA